MRYRALALIILFVQNAYAETVYYDEYAQTTNLRADGTTLLKFISPPLSASCHPGLIQFESLTKGELSLSERERLPTEDDNQAATDDTVSLLIRAKPKTMDGTVVCSFTLAGGNEVAIRFVLLKGLAKPFIEFIPLAQKFGNIKENSQIKTVLSLMNGRSLYLHDVTDEFRSCHSRRPRESHSCSGKTRRTKFADYKLIYAGKSVQSTGWIFELKIQSDIEFSRLADLMINGPSNVEFSVLHPQKKVYQKGEVIKHFVVGGPRLNVLEVLEVLP